MSNWWWDKLHGRTRTNSISAWALPPSRTNRWAREISTQNQKIKNIKRRQIFKLYIPGANKTLEAERRGLCVGRHLAARSKEDCLRWRSSQTTQGTEERQFWSWWWLWWFWCSWLEDFQDRLKWTAKAWRGVWISCQLPVELTSDQDIMMMIIGDHGDLFYS